MHVNFPPFWARSWAENVDISGPTSPSCGNSWSTCPFHPFQSNLFIKILSWPFSRWKNIYLPISHVGYQPMGDKGSFQEPALEWAMHHRLVQQDAEVCLGCLCILDDLVCLKSSISWEFMKLWRSCKCEITSNSVVSYWYFAIVHVTLELSPSSISEIFVSV